MYPEQELVKHLKTKDQTAFRYLYNGYAPALFDVIHRYTKDKNRTEDILQEVFCKVWFCIHSYDTSKGTLFTWLINITKNATIDWTRSKTYRYEQRTFSMDDTDGGSYCPYQYFETKDIRKVVSTMSCRHRNILELAYFNGFTHEQIAKLLQLPLGTVKSRIRGASKHLRILLAGEYQS